MLQKIDIFFLTLMVVDVHVFLLFNCRWICNYICFLLLLNYPSEIFLKTIRSYPHFLTFNSSMHSFFFFIHCVFFRCFRIFFHSIFLKIYGGAIGSWQRRFKHSSRLYTVSKYKAKERHGRNGTQMEHCSFDFYYFFLFQTCSIVIASFFSIVKHPNKSFFNVLNIFVSFSNWYHTIIIFFILF